MVWNVFRGDKEAFSEGNITAIGLAGVITAVAKLINDYQAVGGGS